MSIRTYTRSYYARVEQTYQIETDSLSAEDLEALNDLSPEFEFGEADEILLGLGCFGEEFHEQLDSRELDIQRIDNEED